MNKLNIEYVTEDKIKVAKHNSRVHSSTQIEQLKNSILEFGVTTPIALCKGEIVYGHARFTALKELGHVDFPVVKLDHLTKTQRRAYLIADNKIGLNATWDFNLLSTELDEVKECNFDLLLTGFDNLEIRTLFAKNIEGLVDPDSVPNVSENVISKTGDVWLLGEHRLMCGSSTNVKNVSKLLNNKTPHLCVTDPPYGIEFDATWRQRSSQPSIINESVKNVISNDHIANWHDAWVLFPGDVMYIWYDCRKVIDVFEGIINTGFEIRTPIIWVKNAFIFGRSDYHNQFESCVYVVRKGKNGHFCSDRQQSTVWFIDKNKKLEQMHLAQKPIECMKKPIENNSLVGEIVYDPFVGSGTTMIAGEMIDRIVYAMEIDPVYVDMCVKRWNEFTGKQAKLE